MKRTIQALICFLLVLAGPAALAQVRDIKGKVRDEKGPLQGVSVQVKNTNRGTATDAAGNFAITADQNETLVFSSAGYTAQEVTIGDRTDFTITLAAQPQSLDEVVVVGYGTKKRHSLTGGGSS